MVAEGPLAVGEGAEADPDATSSDGRGDAEAVGAPVDGPPSREEEHPAAATTTATARQRAGIHRALTDAARIGSSATRGSP